MLNCAEMAAGRPGAVKESVWRFAAFSMRSTGKRAVPLASVTAVV